MFKTLALFGVASAVLCPSTLPTVENGTLTCTEPQTHGGAVTACTLDCASMYKVKTLSSTKCSAEGKWTGAVGECQMCGDEGDYCRDNSDNSSFIGKCNGTNKCVITSQCTGKSKDEDCGLESQTDFKGKCDDDDGKCAANNCPAPLVTNGMLTCSDAQMARSAKERCTLTCNDSYEPKFQDTRMCQDGAAWSGTTGVCGKVCPSADETTIDGGKVLCYDAKFAGSDNKCTLRCNAGYRATPSTDGKKCNADGAWEGSAGTCESTNCPASPPAVSNGTFDCSAVLAPGSARPCKLTCADTYRIKTPTGRMCSAESAWTGVAGECEPVPNCTNTGQPTVSDGTFDCSGVMAPGAGKCNLKCDDKYNSTKTPTDLMCSNTGTWTGAPGACEPDHCAAISTAAAIVVAAFALH